MEPIQRRRMEMPQRRSMMGGGAPQRPTVPAHPITAGGQSVLRPPQPGQQQQRPVGPPPPGIAPKPHSASVLQPHTIHTSSTPQRAAAPVSTQPSMLRPVSAPSMDMRPPQPMQTPAPHHAAHHPVTQTAAAPHHAPQPSAAPVQRIAATPSAAPQPPMVQNAASATPVSPASQSETLFHEPQAPVRAQSESSTQHKEPHPTAHAGLVGFIAFLILGCLLLAPLLPGKTWDTAPGSWQAFSTGDQNIDCIGTVGPTTTTTGYDHKAGFPVVYTYATTSRISASCGGTTQHAVGGHTSQFNPIALVIDFSLAVTLAVIASKLWRRFRGVR